MEGRVHSCYLILPVSIFFLAIISLLFNPHSSWCRHLFLSLHLRDHSVFRSSTLIACLPSFLRAFIFVSFSLMKVVRAFRPRNTINISSQKHTYQPVDTFARKRSETKTEESSKTGCTLIFSFCSWRHEPRAQTDTFIRLYSRKERDFISLRIFYKRN